MNKISIILSLLLLSCVLKEAVSLKPLRRLKAPVPKATQTHRPLANSEDTLAVKKEVLASRGTKRRVPTPDYPETSLTDAAIAFDGKQFQRMLTKYVAWTKGTDTHYKTHF